MAYPRKMIPPISQSFEEAMQIIAKGTDEEVPDKAEQVEQKEQTQKHVDSETELDYTD